MTIKEEIAKLNKDAQSIAEIRIQMERELSMSTPHEDIMAGREWDEEAFEELCEEVGIEPEFVTEYTRKRLDSLWQYPNAQRELLEEITEDEA
jgi:hypothetical protein